MKSYLKRLTALILVLAMCLSLISANVWAAEMLPQETTTSTEEDQNHQEEISAAVSEPEPEMEPDTESVSEEDQPSEDTGDQSVFEEEEPEEGIEELDQQEQDAEKITNEDQNEIVKKGEDDIMSEKEMTEITTLASEDGFSYTVSGSYATITSYNGSVSSLTIPSSIGGYTVIAIGDEAFIQCHSITKVTIPYGVRSIGSLAFFCCTKLTRVDISNTVTEIGEWAFANCYKLTSITIPEGIEVIKESVFNQCNNLMSVSIPRSVKKVSENAFLIPGHISNVYYGGNETEWNAIDFTIGNTSLLNATIHYCPFPQTLAEQITDDYTFTSDLKKDNNNNSLNIVNSFHYADVWLMTDDASLRYELMKTSIRVAQAAFGQNGSANIEEMMRKMRYDYTDDSIVYENPEINTIGSAIGLKNIKKGDGAFQSLILVAIRGGGYGTEWGGNFNVGNDSKYHAGFEKAANTVHGRLAAFLAANQEHISSDPIVWITGFSRGAATSNLLASYLINGRKINGTKIEIIQPDNVLAFCFECPKNVVDSNASNAKYNNIINIVNPIDFVPKLAFNRWNFTRYGRTYCIPSKETTPNFESAYKIPMIWKYQELCTRNNAVLTDDYVVELNGQASNLDSLLDEVSSKITRNRYSLYVQESMIEIGANALGNAGGNVNWFHAAVSMIAAINLPADGGDTMKTAVQLALGKLSIVQKIKFVEKVAALCLHAPSVIVMFKDAGDCKGPGASAHYSELCMSWIDSLQGFSAYNTSENSWYRRHIINCPVDVTVRDHTGRVVGKVTNHQAEEIEDGVTAFVDDNDQIVFALPMSEKYTVEVQATDNGNVDYMIQEVNGAEGTLENVIAYQEISVTEGDTITVQSDDTETELSERYVLKKEDEENPREPDAVLTEEEVERFTVTTAVQGNGTVTGGGYVIKGEYVKVTAEPVDGSRFLGWYEGETCICDTPEYRFPVEQDVELTAVFMGASSNDASYQVMIDNTQNGTVTSDKAEAKENDTIILAVTPDKGYQLDNLTYTPEGGEAISIGVNNDGNYAFKMPGAKVTVRAVFTPHNHRVSTEVRNAKAATCGAAGYTGDIWCKDCGIKLEKGRAIPATGKHVWDSGKVTTQPTYTTKGVKTYTCTVCRQTKTESINKLPQPAAAQPTPSQPTAKTSNTISVAARFTKTANPKKNQSFRLGARANGAPLSYQSSNRKKVSVAKNGKVSIKKGFVGKVRITIKSAETDKYLPATKKVTITVQPSATQISSVKWDAKKKVANVNWRKNTTGKGYEVQVSLKMNFKKVAKKAVIKKNDTVKTAIKGLKKGTWYFRIRTVNRKNYSKWSKVKTLKIAK